MRTYLLISVLCFASIATGSTALDTSKIDQITGLKGKMNEKEGVYKVTFPRNDVKVAVDGWTMPPFMGLGTWAAFILTRPLGATLGDFLDKPITEGGLALSRYTASLALVAVIVALILIFPQKPASKAH